MASSALDQTARLRVEPELQAFLPELTEQELSQLEKNLLADPGRVVLTLWLEKNVLLDGHHRYLICRKHHLDYEVHTISLPDMDTAKLWMIREHRGRRNFTDEQRSYFRGTEYELAKKLEGRPPNGNHRAASPDQQYSTKEEETYRRGKQYEGGSPKKKLDQTDPVSTSQRIAKQHSVGEATVRRDAQFTRAVDAIAGAAGNGARKAILSRDVKMTRQDVQKLGEIAKAQPQAAKNVLVQIKSAAKPEQVKRIVQEASRQLPKRPANGELFPDARLEKTIETLKLKGGDGFIIRNPNSEPIFNKTNEMVDWASWTWNPLTGCWHNCDYCYARAIANDERMAEAYPKQFEPCFHEARLKAPANTPFPKVLERPQDRNVFTCSMADLFGKWVPDEWIARVFEQVSQYQQWNFLFLTKFPQRLRSVCDDLLKGFPSNAWVGTTVDSQARVKTAQEAFRGLRAKVRWLSVEPMQERLTFTDMTMFDWLVAGGKSASSFNGTPEFQPEWEWVEHLLNQARAAELKIYFKENLKTMPKEVPWGDERRKR
jgi:protein gp37